MFILMHIVLLQAPFIPFLTEHMYQKMRPLVDPKSTKGSNTESVHYLMLPECRCAVGFCCYPGRTYRSLLMGYFLFIPENNAVLSV